MSREWRRAARLSRFSSFSGRAPWAARSALIRQSVVVRADMALAVQGEAAEAGAAATAKLQAARAGTASRRSRRKVSGRMRRPPWVSGGDAPGTPSVARPTPVLESRGFADPSRDGGAFVGEVPTLTKCCSPTFVGFSRRFLESLVD